ncbi:MAG: hypothetical protein QXT39_00875 [Conexivisphaerales archaeon]
MVYHNLGEHLLHHGDYLFWVLLLHGTNRHYRDSEWIYFYYCKCWVHFQSTKWAGDTFDPSVAIEVNEITSGNFLSDNPFFDAEANVGSAQFYYLGFPSTADFNIGQNSPPSPAYASGVKIGANYYDDFGTSSGIENYMHTCQNIADSVETQTVTTNLPNLNIPYYYLTMSGTGKDSSSLSPGDGWTINGQLIQITATPIGCTTFIKWTGSRTGSYTGTNNPETITMNSDISEVGSFSNYCSPKG